ncbi:hypothetical protein C0V97_06945 [Asaia sp. W19]|nr:hypothetical protein C0V97_06945 [Asaia sp. W19]
MRPHIVAIEGRALPVSATVLEGGIMGKLRVGHGREATGHRRNVRQPALSPAHPPKPRRVIVIGRDGMEEEVEKRFRQTLWDEGCAVFPARERVPSQRRVHGLPVRPGNAGMGRRGRASVFFHQGMSQKCDVMTE